MAQWAPMTLDQIKQQLAASGNIPEELVEIYREEAEEHMRLIYDAISFVSKNQNDMDALATIRRSAHTLKGAAGAVGLEAVTRLSHRMEDMLDRLAENKQGVSSEQLELILNTADRLQDLAGEFNVDTTAEQISELYKEYTSELGEFETGQTTAEKTSGNNVDVSSRPAQATPERRTTPPTIRATEGQFLRVPAQRLDDLVGLVSEMFVNRSAMEQRLNTYDLHIKELYQTIDRLNRSSRELDTKSNSRTAAQQRSVTNSHVTTNPGGAGQWDSLEFDQYNEMHLMALSMSENNSDIEMVANELKQLRGEFDGLVRKQRDLNRQAHQRLMQIRMVPFKGIVNRLERTVRAVATKVNKSINLEVSGDTTELDKTVLDAIVDPLQHLLRNAIDHGIEDGETRKSLGKPKVARIQMEAINHGTEVTIRVSDDGGGINEEKVYSKALQNGLITENDLLASDDVYNLIFTPGFSTADNLTDVSGRGVGMDVVRDAITRLKGTIRVQSEAGVGTTFTIQLPTSVGASRALLVEADEQTFAIPIQAIRRVCFVHPEALFLDEQGILQATIEDQNYPIHGLAAHLQLNSSKQQHAVKTLPVVILQVAGEEKAISVDKVIGGNDIIVKSLGPHLRKVPGVRGATIRGDGSIVPILDPIDLIGGHSEIDSTYFDQQPTSPQKTSTAMVIDDSISVRRVTKNLLSTAGWNVLTARDGVDALDILNEIEVLPDVLLCDMEMPRLDGIELIKNLRKREEFAATPIVMVTSRASEKHRHMAFEAGASDYVVKPYNDEHLLGLIEELVSTAQETVAR